MTPSSDCTIDQSAASEALAAASSTAIIESPISSKGDEQ